MAQPVRAFDELHEKLSIHCIVNVNALIVNHQSINIHILTQND